MVYVQLDFDIDLVKLEAICPAGKVSANASVNKNGDINISEKDEWSKKQRHSKRK